MGTRLHINLHDALKANYTVVFVTQLSSDGEDYFIAAKLTTPDGRNKFYMSCLSDNINSLRTDYNNWGGNKQFIEPILNEFPIPNIQS